MTDHVSKRYLEKLKVLLSSMAEDGSAEAEEEDIGQTDPDSSVFSVCVCVGGGGGGCHLHVCDERTLFFHSSMQGVRRTQILKKACSTVPNEHSLALTCMLAHTVHTKAQLSILPAIVIHAYKFHRECKLQYTQTIVTAHCLLQDS